MSQANSALARPGRARGLILCHALVVALSGVVFAICLTQTAYVSPGSNFGQLNEIQIDSMESSAVSQLLWGWTAIPFALFLFVYPNPLVGVSVAVTLLLAWKRWRKAAITASCVTIMLMWKYHILGLASWMANPLLVATWIFYLINRIRFALLLAASTLTLMVSFLSIDFVPFGPKGADVPITSHALGYWLWIASAVTMFGAVGGEYLAGGRRID
jgi:hypothetical protein